MYDIDFFSIGHCLISGCQEERTSAGHPAVTGRNHGVYFFFMTAAYFGAGTLLAVQEVGADVNCWISGFRGVSHVRHLLFSLRNIYLNGWMKI